MIIIWDILVFKINVNLCNRHSTFRGCECSAYIDKYIISYYYLVTQNKISQTASIKGGYMVAYQYFSTVYGNVSEKINN